MKLGIIGLGTIFKKQNEALKYLEKDIEIVAVCDNNIEKKNEKLENVPFYDNVNDFLQNDNIEAVLIATPPITHFDLASKVIKSKRHVLLEKPATISMDLLNKLYELANENQVILHIAYHASFAVDLKWYIENQDVLKEKYKLGNLYKIICNFYDPYMLGQNILKNKEMLCGSLIDSGVNELSVCDKLTNLLDYKLIEKNVKTKNDVIYASNSVYKKNDMKIYLNTAWDLNANLKTTELLFKDSDVKILLHHSNQQVIIIKNNQENVIYKEDKIERLVRHYIGVFTEFNNVLNNRNNNKEKSLIIHKLLFDEINMN